MGKSFEKVIFTRIAQKQGYLKQVSNRVITGNYTRFLKIDEGRADLSDWFPVSARKLGKNSSIFKGLKGISD